MRRTGGLKQVVTADRLSLALMSSTEYLPGSGAPFAKLSPCQEPSLLSQLIPPHQQAEQVKAQKPSHDHRCSPCIAISNPHLLSQLFPFCFTADHFLPALSSRLSRSGMNCG